MVSQVCQAVKQDRLQHHEVMASDGDRIEPRKLKSGNVVNLDSLIKSLGVPSLLFRNCSVPEESCVVRFAAFQQIFISSIH
jgi:hypothetical protein